MNVNLAYQMTPYEAEKQAKAQDVFDSMILWEAGELQDDAAIEMFQDLLNSGLVWQLQGAYGRHAQMMIDAGTISLQS